MSYYKLDSENCIIVKRHVMYLFFHFLKFLFFIIMAFFLYWFYITYKIPLSSVLWWELNFINNSIFVFIFIILNYSFFKFILSLISYHNNLIIIHEKKVSIIRCTLILKDDMEAIDPMTIKKIDSVSRGIMWNILWYWNLVIEQMDHMRTFHFIPHPEDLINILREQKLTIFNQSYVIKKVDTEYEKK